MREKLKTARNRALQLELMLRGAAASDILAAGGFAEAISETAEALADDLSTMLERYDDASKEGPIALVAA